MPYQTGSVASFAALKTEIFTFLTSNGWTQENDIVKRNGVFAKITTGVRGWDGDAYIQLEGAKSSDGAGNLIGTPSTPPVSSLIYGEGRMIASLALGGPNAMVFPITYNFHLHSSPVDEFWCFIQYNGDNSQHMGFGNVAKSTDYVGGGFYSSSVNSQDSPGSSLYTITSANLLANAAAANSTAFEIIPFNGGSGSNPAATSGSFLHAEVAGVEWFTTALIGGGGGSYGNFKYMMNSHRILTQERLLSESTVNGIPNLIPMRLYGRGFDDNFQRLGEIENIRFSQISNINFGQIESDGTDNWKFYPSLKKNASELSGGIDHSSNWGIAVRYDGP